MAVPFPFRARFRAVLFFVLVLLCVPALSQAQTLSQSGKNWKVRFTTNFVHDDNLGQNPSAGAPILPQADDSGFHWSGSGTYLHTFNDQWSVEGSYDIDQTVYQDLGQYDMLNNSWGLRPKYQIKNNLFAELQYLYIWSMAGGNSFSGVNYVGPTLTHIHEKFGMTQVRFFYSNTNNFRNQARDADEFGGGFMHFYIFPGTQNYVGAGYQASNQDTTGRFDRTIHRLKLKGRVVLPEEIHFTGQYQFSFRDYDTFASTGGGIREDEQHNFTFSLSKVMWEQLGFLSGVKADLSWVHTQNDSNTLFREFISDRFTGGISAGF